MTTSYDIQGEIHRFCQESSLARPNPRRDRFGRWHRDTGAEWDWFYALSETERTYIQRVYMTDAGVKPDVLAGWHGLSVDEAMGMWLELVREIRAHARRKLDPLDEAYFEDEPEVSEIRGKKLRPTEPIGLQEIAELLGVDKQTPKRWHYRELLPKPSGHVSGTPWWTLESIEGWARATGRL
jgi:hypothetical protein